MAPWRNSPTLAEWWRLDGTPYRVIAERIGVVHQRAAGIAKDRGFRRGQGKRSSRWTHGPCLGDGCRDKLAPVPVERLDADRLCATCRTQRAARGPVVDVAEERRAWMRRNGR